MADLDELEQKAKAGQSASPDVVLALVQQIRSYEEAQVDKRSLVREIDVIISGEVGAARQASLCDLVRPIQVLVARVRELEAERRELLSIKTKEGLLASEWLSRTAKAEARVRELEAVCQRVSRCGCVEDCEPCQQALAAVVKEPPQ